jgi:outer membrane protein
MKTQTTVGILLLLVSLANSLAAETAAKKTLADCIAIAIAQHPDLRAARFAADVGHAQTWEAISTALPQINASYSAQRRHTSAGASTGTQIGGKANTFSFYSTGLTFSQILFDFGQSLYAIRAAQASERSLEANVTTARETVIFNVKQGYVNLLQARRLLAVADENVRDNQKHVDLAKGRLDVGVATRFDVTQAEVQLANAELAQVTARNNVAVARETFRNALGGDEPLGFEIEDTLDVHDVQVDPDKAVEIAYEHRPEILSLELQQKSLGDQITARRLSYLPTVNGNANYNYSGSQYPLENTWTVGAAVNLSVFNGGLTTAQIDADKASLAQLQAQEQSLRHQVSLAVRQAALNLAQAADSIRVSEKGLQSARENLAIAEGQYAAGVGNIIALTDAEAGLITAEGNNVQALAGHKNAVAALEQATARSFTPDLPD